MSSPKSSRAIWLAATEAVGAHHESVGSGHLILGLLRSPGAAADVLSQFEVDYLEAKDALLKLHP